MSSLASSALRLAIQSDTTPYPYLTLEGVESLRYALSHNAQAAPHLGDEGWPSRRAEAGQSQLTVQLSGIATSHVADAVLRTHALARTAASFQLHLGDGSSLSGPFVIREYTHETSTDGEGLMRFSARLESADALTFTPAT